MRRETVRWICATLAVVCLIAWTGVPQYLAQDEPPQEDVELAKRFFESKSRQIELMREMLAQASERFAYDVRTRALRLGSDPQRICDFVQKEIRYEPYAGIQRGSSGVLISGAGNSGDKSTLLCELLRVSGFEARLVRGTLDDAAKERLLRSVVEPPAPPTGPFGESPALEKNAREVARRIGLVEDEAVDFLRSQESGNAAAWEDVLAVTSREVAFLREATANLGAAKSIREDLLRSMDPHYWVQWKAPGKGWTDFDPCSAGAIPQKREIVKERDAADRLHIAVRLERKADEKRETVVVLRHDLPLFETLESPIRFTIQPDQGDALRDPAALRTEASLFEKLSELRRFQAILMIGEERLGSKVFDYDGVVSEIKGNGSLEAVGDFGKSLEKGLGGFLEGDRKKAVKGELTNLWVEFEVRRGKESVWSHRRTILEEAKRPSWCPILQWNFLVQTHEVPAEFVRFKRLEHRVRNDGMIRGMLDWGYAGARGDVGELLRGNGYHYPLDLLGFCLSRQSYVHGLGGARRLHFARPNLFLITKGFALDAERKLARVALGVDLVENGALVLKDGALDRDATTALGVFDTVLEETSLRDSGGAVFGAIAFFERARATSTPVRAISGSDGKALREAGFPDGVAREGEYVIAAGGSAAWWSFDPATGSAVGRIAGGRGGAETCLEVPQTALEKAYLLMQIWDWANVLFCLVNVVLYLNQKDYGGAALKALLCGVFYLAGHPFGHRAKHALNWFKGHKHLMHRVANGSRKFIKQMAPHMDQYMTSMICWFTIEAMDTGLNIRSLSHHLAH